MSVHRMLPSKDQVDAMRRKAKDLTGEASLALTGCMERIMATKSAADLAAAIAAADSTMREHLKGLAVPVEVTRHWGSPPP